MGQKPHEVTTAHEAERIHVALCSGATALPAFKQPLAVLAGFGVGIASSVIPYVLDQFAMARVKRSTYALLVSPLPATATVVGLVVLAQVPTLVEVIGVSLVILAVGLHREP